MAVCQMFHRDGGIEKVRGEIKHLEMASRAFAAAAAPNGHLTPFSKCEAPSGCLQVIFARYIKAENTSVVVFKLRFGIYNLDKSLSIIKAQTETSGTMTSGKFILTWFSLTWGRGSGSIPSTTGWLRWVPRSPERLPECYQLPCLTTLAGSKWSTLFLPCMAWPFSGVWSIVSVRANGSLSAFHKGTIYGASLICWWPRTAQAPPIWSHHPLSAAYSNLMTRHRLRVFNSSC